MGLDNVYLVIRRDKYRRRRLEADPASFRVCCLAMIIFVDQQRLRHNFERSIEAELVLLSMLHGKVQMRDEDANNSGCFVVISERDYAGHVRKAHMGSHIPVLSRQIVGSRVNIMYLVLK